MQIVAETLLPAAEGMLEDDLRNHSREILLAIAKEMETIPFKAERLSKLKRTVQVPGMAGAPQQRIGRPAKGPGSS